MFLGKNNYNAKIYDYTILLYYHSIGKSMSLTVDEGTITEAVVHRLLQGLENKGHHVFMDNFYLGPHLYKELKKKGFGACGTVRLNRKGMPAEWKGKNEKSKNGGTRKRKGTEILKKGEMRSVDLKNGLLALQWRDKRVVNMISTIHNSDIVIKKTTDKTS